MRSLLSAGMAKFARAEGGNTAIIFGSSLLMLAAVTGGAIDFSATFRIRSAMQSTLDAALLAGAQAMAVTSNATLGGSAVTSAFATNWKQNNTGTAPGLTYAIDPSGKVTGEATLTVPTMLLGVIGIDSVALDVTSEVAFGAGNAEVALILDNTGSMAGTKIQCVQTAAKQLIDMLYATPGSSAAVKISLVPFSNYVNVGMANRKAAWMSVQDDYSVPQSSTGQDYNYTTSSSPGTCYNDGTAYACTVTNSTPIPGSLHTVTNTWTDYYNWYGCAGSRTYPLDVNDEVRAAQPVPGVMNVACPTPIQRLTNDSASLKAQVDQMAAAGETFIGSGLVWGWRTISPKGPFADAAPYNGATRKVAVLMTDGANTKSPQYPDHEGGDVGLSNKLMKETCTNMKAQGIAIYTIAFDVTDPTILALLTDCATAPPYAYNAATVAQLSTAFATIGQNLTAVRMSK